jgi:hypothetical protein
MGRATDALDSVIVIPPHVAQIAVVTAAIDRSCHFRESERKEGQSQCTDDSLTAILSADCAGSRASSIPRFSRPCYCRVVQKLKLSATRLPTRSTDSPIALAVISSAFGLLTLRRIAAVHAVWTRLNPHL